MIPGPNARSPMFVSNTKANLRFAKAAALLLILATGIGANGSDCGGTIPDPNNPGSCAGTVVAAPQVLSQDHVMGDANAPLTVVEYVDFQCPFCGAFARSEFATIKQNYIDTGKVRWVVRHFPLRNIHADAEAAAQASECAHDQGDFFEYHDALFSDQQLSAADLSQKADDLGLNVTTFDDCLNGGGKATRVQQDVTSGTALGITGTPAFFVGNIRVTGFQTAEELSEIIDCKLANP